MILSNIKVKVKIGSNEAEVEAPIELMSSAIEFIPKLMEMININSQEVKNEVSQVLPEIKIEKDDSLSEIILKLFKSEWGKSSRRLSDVKSILESYGLSYPKQSIAVTLLRLAQNGKLRRFKDNNNEYVYTASIQLINGA
jgi:hypothetical protein